MGLSTREAVAAAPFVHRSKLKNPTAIANLGRLAAELGLFDHKSEPDEEDREKAYQRRLKAEREAKDTSDVSRESADTNTSPMQVIGNRRKAHMDKLINEAKPTLRLAAPPQDYSVTDPTSIDFQDPEDFLRTPLIKAAIDGDDKRVEDLVNRGANLYARDIEGNNALQNALNFGNDEVAFYLKRAMYENPQRTTGIKIA